MSQTTKPSASRGRPLPPDSAIFPFIEGMGPSDKEEGPDVDGGIYCSIMILNSVIERMGNRMLEPHDLTLPQWLALGSILHCGEEGIPHALLGARLMLSKAPVTGVVDRLQRAGLVERHPDPVDRRVSRVVGTPQGLAKWHAVKETLHEDSGNDLDQALNEDEQNQLLDLLGKLLESFANGDAVVAEMISQRNQMAQARIASGENKE